MKRNVLLIIEVLLLIGFAKCSGGGVEKSKISGNGNTALLTIDTLKIEIGKTPKLLSGENNPLIDYIFTADPTAVEYEGRIYVYGTNDHEQYLNAPKNSYEKIRSLVMISSADMVNWTYHGIINVGKIAPWIINSWAPSIVSRKESDGLTHFYLYFSNNGTGVGVITATSPIGPWSDPLGKPLVSFETPTLGDCPNPFDPGAVIDANGVGWLAFGAGVAKDSTDYMPGVARIVRLGSDLLSFNSNITEIPAPYIFEASELNYLNGTWIYTYCNSWKDRNKWPFAVEKPGICSMSFMTSQTPLDKDSWTYRGAYFNNPGESVPPLTNNHTHLHKFNGKYYLFYHSMYLQNYFDTEGGFRNIGVEEIQVDEATCKISSAKASRKGVSQIAVLNPFCVQSAATVAATYNVKFEENVKDGYMTIAGSDKNQCTLVKGVEFAQSPQMFEANVKGKGGMDIHIDSLEGEIIASLRFENTDWNTVSTKVIKSVKGTHDLYFILSGETFRFDKWKFKETD